MQPLIIFVTYHPSMDFFDRIPSANHPKLLVDNTPNQNKDFIKKASDLGIAIISNHENLGIATALNQGCQYAIEQGYDWVVTMDQDSQLTDEIIQNLTDYAAGHSTPEKLAVISPRHVIQGGKVTGLQESYATPTSEDIFTMQSGNLISLVAWKSLGGFKDEYFMDMVDIEYYCRAITTGRKVITLNDCYMHHELGYSESKSLFGLTFNIHHHSPVRKYYQVRNTFMMVNAYRDHPSLNVKRFKYMSVYKNILGVLLYEKDKLKKLKHMYLGWRDYRHHKMGKLH